MCGKITYSRKGKETMKIRKNDIICLLLWLVILGHKYLGVENVLQKWYWILAQISIISLLIVFYGKTYKNEEN